MNDNFKKIKRRALIVRLLKSLLAGAAVALPVIGALLLLVRFETVTMRTALIVVIGCLSGLVVSACVFFLLRRSDKRIAMQLDSKYRLNEKVQTMLAYKDRQGDPMIDLQRKDANEALETAKKSVLGLGRLWIFALLLMVGLGIFIVSLFFRPAPPAPLSDPEPEPEIPYEVSEMQLAALAELIETVRDSEMESPYREGVVTALETLDTEIRNVTTVSGKDEVVTRAMEEILLQTDESSQAVEIINALWRSGEKPSRLLAKAMNYYEWPKNDEWELFTEKMSDFRAGFDHADAAAEDADAAVIIEDTKTLYISLYNSIGLVLQQLKVEEDDALAAVLNRLASANEENADGTRVYGMQVLADYVAQNGYTMARRELEATLNAVSGQLFQALSHNNLNTDTGENAVAVLAGLFDVMAPAFERPELFESSDTGGAGGDEGSGSGGISGGPGYGSDDKVYDPFTNRYVEYGTILDKYYAIMFGNISDGSYTDEEQKALAEYFKILYGGFETEGDQNEE